MIDEGASWLVIALYENGVGDSSITVTPRQIELMLEHIASAGPELINNLQKLQTQIEDMH